ncbi:lamin tail domain-containing protein [Streptomyces sp. NPDC087422]|uniref:lamin tail domain-containing protein n=1 Tax=Streptomyces sp. NPDC087422 TaxID=3365786 RepID=UPI00381EEEA7
MRVTRSTAVSAAIAAAAAAVAVLLPVPASAATGSVHLAKIYYDSPGTDRRSNASLNAEYVQIANTTTRDVSLKGWTLTDAAGHRYTFGTYTLGARKTVTMHTGKGTNTAANRYQKRSWYVWNNDKDTSTLRKNTGTRVDVCSYNSTEVEVLHRPLPAVEHHPHGAAKAPRCRSGG